MYFGCQICFYKVLKGDENKIPKRNLETQNREMHVNFLKTLKKTTSEYKTGFCLPVPGRCIVQCIPTPPQRQREKRPAPRAPSCLSCLQSIQRKGSWHARCTFYACARGRQYSDERECGALVSYMRREAQEPSDAQRSRARHSHGAVQLRVLLLRPQLQVALWAEQSQADLCL